MILGVYWYYQFPENLYQFQYFNFERGYGGHIDNRAELHAVIKVPNPENILPKLKNSVSEFPSASLYVGMHENLLSFTISGYYLFDFHFQLAREIEKLLVSENAVSPDLKAPFIKEYEQIFKHSGTDRFDPVQHRFLQIVGSEFKKNNAENLSIRIDCYLSVSHKTEFILDVKKSCLEENIHVFYYHEKEFDHQCNLMIFFTNGRQKQEDIQFVDINSFGRRIRLLGQKYPLQFGHFGGMEYYPLTLTKVELMTDDEYIIQTKTQHHD
ncbi:hypothetical protein VUJ46_09520 [Chryseobacterium sp. MYb264]|uniref:hypothetical protein n=1 Tax=Chryseobacterium sp. MYb264 TaxID=2745153 RepID=UPI002E162E73|nr:hypothetical protein VUJ46_09520 [Chryseobacterium sp. MYb264]